MMEMGFEEMPTNKWVENTELMLCSSPRATPAREMHDTFFMKTPHSTPTVRLLTTMSA
jgi:phenylalanyl-tRNA synthetase alpha subunit